MFVARCIPGDHGSAFPTKKKGTIMSPKSTMNSRGNWERYQQEQETKSRRMQVVLE